MTNPTNASTVYASGLSRPGNARPFIRVGAPVGMVAGELSANMRNICTHYAGAGGKVFIDSGAFTVFTKGGTVDFDAILDTYFDVAEGCAQPGNLAVVAPDVVGDQAATLELLRKHASRLADLSALGVDVLVPLQDGELQGIELFAAVEDALDYLVTWVPAFPFNKAAWDIAGVARFVSEVEPEAVHLLGAGFIRLPELAAVVAEACPTTLVRGDANRARAWVGSDRPLAKAVSYGAELLASAAAFHGVELDEAQARRQVKDGAMAQRIASETGDPELEALFASPPAQAEAVAA